MHQEQFEAESVLSGIPVEGVDTTVKPLVSEPSPDHSDLGPLGREMVRKETVGAEEGLRAEGIECRLLGDSSEGQADREALKGLPEFCHRRTVSELQPLSELANVLLNSPHAIAAPFECHHRVIVLGRRGEAPINPAASP